MTELLDKAIQAAQKLPAAEQDAIARDVLARISARAEPVSEKPDLKRIREIAARCSRRPIVDRRSTDEILGYDDVGVPR